MHHYSHYHNRSESKWMRHQLAVKVLRNVFNKSNGDAYHGICLQWRECAKDLHWSVVS
jgi:hypothetical protein